MESPAVAAKYLRIIIEAGIAEPSEAVIWADRHISASDNPDAVILEVALAGSRPRHEMTSLLGEISGDRNDPAITEAVLGRLHRDFVSGKRDAEGTAKALSVISRYLPDSHRWEATTFWDDYELAHLGIRGDPGAVADDLREWLQPFAGKDGIIAAA